MAKRIRVGRTVVRMAVTEAIRAVRMAARTEVPTAVVEGTQPRREAMAAQVVGITVVQAAVTTAVLVVVAAVTVQVLMVEEDIAKPG
jgi:hypothetical protein